MTTGVSAADRIRTIRTAISPAAKPDDLNHPVTFFRSLPGKTAFSERGGHTEGSVDLMKLAKLSPFAVLCELTNPDGSMARMPEIRVFSEKHGFPIVTIADIKAYRNTLVMAA